MSTGQTCQTSGIYRSDCSCHTQIALSRGERFPPCGGCLRAVNWRLIQATQHRHY